MKYIYAVLLICCFLLGCKIRSDKKSENVSLKVLNYGRSSAKLLYLEDDNKMPSGKRGTTDFKLNVLEHTDTIKLIKGVQFGIEYIVKSPASELITLTTVWTLPSTMVNDEGKEFDVIKYDIEKFTNQYSYSNYTIEADYEMLPGKWNLKILNKDKKILDKDFYLVDIKK